MELLLFSRAFEAEQKALFGAIETTCDAPVPPIREMPYAADADDVPCGSREVVERFYKFLESGEANPETDFTFELDDELKEGACVPVISCCCCCCWRCRFRFNLCGVRIGTVVKCLSNFRRKSSKQTEKSSYLNPVRFTSSSGQSSLNW